MLVGVIPQRVKAALQKSRTYWTYWEDFPLCSDVIHWNHTVSLWVWTIRSMCDELCLTRELSCVKSSFTRLRLFAEAHFCLSTLACVHRGGRSAVRSSLRPGDTLANQKNRMKSRPTVEQRELTDSQVASQSLVPLNVLFTSCLLPRRCRKNRQNKCARRHQTNGNHLKKIGPPSETCRE